MNREPDERFGPEDRPGPDIPSDQFEAIVAGWRKEGRVPEWPGEEQVDHPRDAVPEPGDPDAFRTCGAVRFRPEPVPGQEHAVPPKPVPPPPEEEHFVPPEPPPLPRIGPPAAVGLVLLTLGVILCTVPSVVGVPSTYGLPLGLVSLAAGLGWLVLRLWPSTPPRGDGHGEDDGAVL